MAELLSIALLGGLLALDATSVGQFMLSRPMIAGAFTGWLVGDPVAGFAIGGLLELYLLVSFPSGGAQFPDGTTAAVVAVAAASASGAAGALPIGVAFGILWGQIAGYSVTEMRKLNSYLVPEATDPTLSSRRITGAHLGGIGFDFLRGFVFTALGAFVGRLFVGTAAPVWPLAPGPSFGLVLAGAAASVGILLHDLGGFRQRKVLFAAGVALGVVGARFL